MLQYEKLLSSIFLQKEADSPPPDSFAPQLSEIDVDSAAAPAFDI